MLAREEIVPVEFEAALQVVENFFESRRTKKTRESYRRILRPVIGYPASDKDLALFLLKCKHNVEDAEMQVENWVKKYRGGHSAYTILVTVSIVNSLLKYAKKFLGGRDFEFDWTNIKSSMPPVKRKSSRKRAPPVANVQKVYKLADTRGKFLIPFLASSGVRLGAFGYLRVKDLHELKIGDITFARLTVYNEEVEEEDPSEYSTFISSEAYANWLEYRELRVRSGERLTDESPLFRTEFDPRAPVVVKRLSPESVQSWMHDLWRKAGLPASVRGSKSVHGFRSFFETRLQGASKNHLLVKKLMGRSLGIDGSYYDPTIDEMAQEYANFMSALIISPEAQAKAEARKANEEKTKLENDVNSEIRLLRLEKEISDQKFEKLKAGLSDVQALAATLGAMQKEIDDLKRKNAAAESVRD